MHSSQNPTIWETWAELALAGKTYLFYCLNPNSAAGKECLHVSVLDHFWARESHTVSLCFEYDKEGQNLGFDLLKLFQTVNDYYILNVCGVLNLTMFDNRSRIRLHLILNSNYMCRDLPEDDFIGLET